MSDHKLVTLDVPPDSGGQSHRKHRAPEALSAPDLPKATQIGADVKEKVDDTGPGRKPADAIMEVVGPERAHGGPLAKTDTGKLEPPNGAKFEPLTVVRDDDV